MRWDTPNLQVTSGNRATWWTVSRWFTLRKAIKQWKAKHSSNLIGKKHGRNRLHSKIPRLQKAWKNCLVLSSFKFTTLWHLQILQHLFYSKAMHESQVSPLPKSKNNNQSTNHPITRNPGNENCTSPLIVKPVAMTMHSKRIAMLLLNLGKSFFQKNLTSEHTGFG